MSRSMKGRRRGPVATLKTAATVFLAFNIFRIAAIILLSYETYAAVLKSDGSLSSTTEDPLKKWKLSDPPTRGHLFLQYYCSILSKASCSNSTSDTEHELALTYTDQPETEMKDERASIEEQIHIVTSFVVVVAEIVSSFIYTAVVIGPVTKHLPVRLKLVSLFRLRITWERLLWVPIVAVYVYMNAEFRAGRYAETGLEKYHESTFELAIAWLGVAEYALLGITESTLELITRQRVETAVSKVSERVGTYFGGIMTTAYLACNAAFAIRNLSVCIYFAFAAVFVVENERDNVEADLLVPFIVIVVLQAIVAMMRGSYGTLYLRVFLGYFLDEGEKFASDISRVENKQKLDDGEERRDEKEEEEDEFVTHSQKKTLENKTSLTRTVEIK